MVMIVHLVQITFPFYQARDDFLAILGLWGHQRSIVSLGDRETRVRAVPGRIHSMSLTSPSGFLANGRPLLSTPKRRAQKVSTGGVNATCSGVRLRANGLEIAPKTTLHNL